MCRMFAVRASHAGEVVGDLLLAEHSLYVQSQCDLTRRDHSDGWGMASYHGDSIRGVRRSSAAHQDEQFAIASRSKRATTVLAHVRRASKGLPKLENCHPFVWGRWAFMHNGTLTAVESLRPEMLRQMDSTLQSLILGETDSELMFYWLMQRLMDAEAIEGARCKSLSRLRRTLANSIALLDELNQNAEAERDSKLVAKLNVVLTNGSVLIATRLRNSLHYLQVEYPRPGKLPHRAISIASEPTDARPWQEIPNGSVISISSRLRIAIEPLEIAT